MTAFPTVVVTPGSGQTINTLPNAGQVDKTSSLSVVVASDQPVFPVTSLASGAITNPQSTLTRAAAATTSAAVAVITTSSPYITWPTSPPINGQGIFFVGTAPTNFTVGTTYWVRDASGTTFNLSAALGTAAIVPGSAGTFSAALEYKPLDLIASSAATPVVPSFAIANSAGGALIARIRVQTNSLWSNVLLSVNLWTAAPTYVGGDGQIYNVATGSANWLANFQITLTQFGDGSVGAGALTVGNEMALKLASGTAVFWDLQSLSYAQPQPAQTFTLTVDDVN